MFQRLMMGLCGLMISVAGMAADPEWVEGTHYVVLDPPQQTATPGKIEVLEVFSYGCPHCKDFQPIADKIKQGLPANAQFRYMPAELGRESWGTFARAFYVAEAMGVLDKTHAALFAAIYTDKKVDAAAPTLEQIGPVFTDAAGVKAEDFVATAKSFAVNTKLKRGDAQIRAMGVSGTPTLIINGKYRVESNAAGSYAGLINLVKFLVAKEGGK
ncbi:MAG: thiol:disulfide interchange protein DsbA/DsbL [Tahibacter sp.]